jgi:hypothetical protein
MKGTGDAAFSDGARGGTTNGERNGIAVVMAELHWGCAAPLRLPVTEGPRNVRYGTSWNKLSLPASLSGLIKLSATATHFHAHQNKQNKERLVLAGAQFAIQVCGKSNK